ncbi:hypothetical protein [Flavilitoribacter nigricans]|nr:hypothetical protein [Flavilitoribacter nigricans]
MPIALFQDMNPWEFEKVSWEEMPEFDLSSIKSGMEQAWQSSDRLLRELNRLKKRLKKEPVSSKKFRFDDPRQQRYFGGVESGPNTKNLSSDFEKDIEAMISMLERLESTDKVRFHYF